jgi:hypothetical protein
LNLCLENEGVPKCTSAESDIPTAATEEAHSVAPVRFRIFRFVIQRFGGLRSAWLLTQAFDSGLGVLTFVTAPRVAGSIRSIKRLLRTWMGVSMSRHPLGGMPIQLQWDRTGSYSLEWRGRPEVDLDRTSHGARRRSRAKTPHRTEKYLGHFLPRGGENQTDALMSLFQIPFARVTNLQQASTESPSEEYVP